MCLNCFWQYLHTLVVGLVCIKIICLLIFDLCFENLPQRVHFMTASPFSAQEGIRNCMTSSPARRQLWLYWLDEKLNKTNFELSAPPGGKSIVNWNSFLATLPSQKIMKEHQQIYLKDIYYFQCLSNYTFLSTFHWQYFQTLTVGDLSINCIVTECIKIFLFLLSF